jgi:hypothetical protein
MQKNVLGYNGNGKTEWKRESLIKYANAILDEIETERENINSSAINSTGSIFNRLKRCYEELKQKAAEMEEQKLYLDPNFQHVWRNLANGIAFTLQEDIIFQDIEATLIALEHIKALNEYLKIATNDKIKAIVKEDEIPTGSIIEYVEKLLKAINDN